ncbi:MAG: plasmid pRiA4b ORF-3 family protein [Candidatus Poribacteria bacterium]
MATKNQLALIYQMKVMLTDIKPPILRRFLVVSDITLYKLHLILQTIMGWENYHLYEFTIDNELYGEPDEEYKPDINRASRFRLNQVIHTEKQVLHIPTYQMSSWSSFHQVGRKLQGCLDQFHH